MKKFYNLGTRNPRYAGNKECLVYAFMRYIAGPESDDMTWNDHQTGHPMKPKLTK